MVSTIVMTPGLMKTSGRVNTGIPSKNKSHEEKSTVLEEKETSLNLGMQKHFIVFTHYFP